MEQDKLNNSTAVPSTSLDAIYDFSSPLTLYRDRKKAVKNLNKRMLLAFVCLLINAALVLIVFPKYAWLPVSLAGFILWQYLYQRRAHLRSTKPVIEMSLEGLAIHSLLTDICIPWEEIKEVRVYKKIYTFIGVVPVDLKQTLNRGSFFTKIIGYSNNFFKPAADLHGSFSAPINIPAVYLPLDAVDIVSLIEARKLFSIKSKAQLPPARD